MVTQLSLAMAFAIIVSALCSITEAALYSLSMSHIEVMINEGRRSGRILKQLKGDIAQPITAILTLNTIANTMGAALAGAAAAEVFGDNALAWFSAVFTLMILFFSEIMPKTAGVTYAKELAPAMSYPLYYLVKVMKPLIRLCELATTIIRREEEGYFASAKELQAIAALSQKSGEIDRQEEKTIINILELKNKTVRKAMTPRTVTFCLSEHLTVGEAQKHEEKWHLHSRVPVYDRDPDDVVGIVLRKDLLISAVEGKSDTRLTELMHAPNFVPEAAPLPNVLMEFFEHRQHLFVVVDEYGNFTGVISLEDIIEEIMGEEIMDETDRTRSMRELARFKRMALKAKGK